MHSNNPVHIKLIGFGEAAAALVAGWQQADIAVSVCAYDIKTDSNDAGIRDGKFADYEKAGVTGYTSLDALLALDGPVFSLVTADQAASVAQNVAATGPGNTLFLDCNSCAPGTKKQSAIIIDDAGGRYIDAAVMAPVHPKLHHVPMSLCGAHAGDGIALLQSLDMKPTLVDGDIGAASSIKMIRSIMMKGLEALFAECVLAGRKSGVDKVVLDSLDVTWPGFDFPGKAGYMLERSMSHGIRRAAEMREVVKTIEELGLSPDMAAGIVEWQQRIGDLHLSADSKDYTILADQLLEKM